MYALNLNDENRILSITLDKYAPEGQPRVGTLPDGDANNYKYINKKYVYDPLPEPNVEADPGPTAEDDLTIMAVDHEYRLTILELGLVE